MTIAELLRLLLPPGVYDPFGVRAGVEMDAHAAVIDTSIASINRLDAAISPLSAGQDISEWERLVAIVPPPASTQAQRAAAVLAKLGELGGLSIAYFTRLAAAVGYDVTITEARAFRTGISRCGERLYGDDAIFYWEVRINTRPADATAAMDDALEQTFDDLKPAHTFCQFLET